MDCVEIFSIFANFSRIANKVATIVFQNNTKESFRIEAKIKGMKSGDNQKIEVLLEERIYSNMNFPRIDSLLFYPKGHKMVVSLGSKMENWSVKVNSSEFPASVEVK